jgi:hypothetical protein
VAIEAMTIEAKRQGIVGRGIVRRGRGRCRGVISGAFAALCLFGLGAGFAAAQGATPQPAQQAPESAPAAPAENPGLVNTFGQWMQRGVSSMGAGFGSVVGKLGGQANTAAKGAADAATTFSKGAADAAKGAADAARDTATTVTKLPASGVIAGRERCMLAPNGAPDCRVAAEAMCRAKGYNSGTSVDFETSEKCPPSYRVTSRVNAEDASVCTMEHFVTKALCQ